MSSATGQPKDNKVEGHEYLGVCVVLSLIYFLAPRPDLYWSIGTWLTEALEVAAGWLHSIL